MQDDNSAQQRNLLRYLNDNNSYEKKKDSIPNEISNTFDSSEIHAFDTEESYRINEKKICDEIIELSESFNDDHYIFDMKKNIYDRNMRSLDKQTSLQKDMMKSMIANASKHI